MTQTLPQPRDLPQRRHAEIRAELLREVARHRRPRWVVPVLAGACSVVLVVLAIVFLPTEQQESAPPAWVRKGPPALPAGITLEERTAIEEGCAAEVGQPPDFRLHNVLSDEYGQVATLYRGVENLTCTVSPDGVYSAIFRPPPDPEPRRWGPGALGFEQMGSGENTGAYQVGRARADVVRVTVGYLEDRMVEAVVANGTYVARDPARGDEQARGELIEIRGYDADGNLVDTLRPTDGHHEDCYVHPDGRYMSENGGFRDLPTDGCKPASPWP